jgi:hypothetical protein
MVHWRNDRFTKDAPLTARGLITDQSRPYKQARAPVLLFCQMHKVKVITDQSRPYKQARAPVLLFREMQKAKDKISNWLA